MRRRSLPKRNWVSDNTLLDWILTKSTFGQCACPRNGPLVYMDSSNPIPSLNMQVDDVLTPSSVWQLIAVVPPEMFITSLIPEAQSCGRTIVLDRKQKSGHLLRKEEQGVKRYNVHKRVNGSGTQQLTAGVACTCFLKILRVNA